MKLAILSVGRPGAWSSLIQRYETRAARYWNLESAQVPRGSGADPSRALRAEAKALKRRLSGQRLTAAITRSGEALSTRDFSAWLSSLQRANRRGVDFLIGGAWGLDQELLSRSDRRLSLSALTMPHDLARLVLLEQLYRVGTMRRNEPYHKGPA